MAQIEFQVSAKTARLIGRENISDVDGALVELIKNAYDADASCVFVKFIMPFHAVPHNVSPSKLNEFFKKEELNEIMKYYEIKDEIFVLKDQLSNQEKDDLQKRLFCKNEIIVIDNGSGMTESVIKNAWMQIGTSDKEYNIYSDKGRIKTGAKGIGRFALDKLSLESQVYTKNANDKLIHWKIDWEQFSNTKLLNQIHAEISSSDIEYEFKVKELINEEINFIKDHKFNTGTAIILTPTREMWSERFFSKVNNNLQSIIPLTSADKFDVIVSNSYFPKYNFIDKDKKVREIDYDYKISGNFDGEKHLKIKISRNEIDIQKEKIQLIVDDEIHDFDASEFWNRPAFTKDNYNRMDYSKNFEQVLDLNSILKDDELENLGKLGEFSFDIYFLKVGKSDLEIVKNVNISKRKRFFKNFSGIKLYRDDFKVRPYGDEGSLFDWIGLGRRAQKSPAAVTHADGNWRVEPYQVVGNVNIGRISNPLLTDMANREGLNPNPEYILMVEILEIVFKNFEFDRQYILREYAKWRKEKIESVSTVNTVVDSIINKSKSDNEDDKKYEYTGKDYEKAIKFLASAKDDQQKTTQILMAFSSAGVMANTFSHEISRIATDVGSRMQHLRESIKRILNYEDYHGDEDFNPFFMIDAAENTDELLDSWISIIMKAVDSTNFSKEELELSTILEKIKTNWIPLMNKKYIDFNTNYYDESLIINMAEIDLHLILNNFFLNSAWFLEDSKFDNRLIFIKTTKENEKVVLYLENNGPPLSENYLTNPSIIFNAGETSKGEGKGTGLGLWIVREVVNRYSSQIEVLNKTDGFGLKITFE